MKQQRRTIAISTAAFLLVAILISFVTAPYFREAEREMVHAVASDRVQM